MSKQREADRAVNISDLITDRKGMVRWAVMATFVDVDGAEPRCIEYRVRVVPRMPNKIGSVWMGHQVIELLERQMAGERSEPYLAAELSAPAEGIPRRVFEEASQSKLLTKARAKAKRRPDLVDTETARLLERQVRPRRGRPPATPMGERLRILQAIEAVYAGPEGRLEDVAAAFHMSRSSVRDLLRLARRDGLFTNYGPGRRGGELTPAARALLKKEVK